MVSADVPISVPIVRIVPSRFGGMFLFPAIARKNSPIPSLPPCFSGT
jgi:hypothetical protein